MGRPASTLRQAAAAGVALVALAAGPVAAQEPAPTTTVTAPVAPTSTTGPTTTAAPTTTTAPGAAPAGPREAVVSVDDEASYRDAVAAFSAASSGPNTIELAADIVVDDGADPTYTGDADLVVDGRGHRLDGAGANRLLVVESADAELTLSDITVRGGRAVGDGGGIWSGGGAAVSVAGSTFADNHASGDGGAIAAVGNVGADGSTFEGNEAPGGDGGAIDAGATFAIETSTFVGNTARRGGAVSTAGESAFRDDTFTGNTATERGGGLRATGGERLILLYVTLAANRAPTGANLDAAAADPDVMATALADPLGGANCAVAAPLRATSGFSDDTSCGTSGWVGTEGGDALLGPLQDNGGPTATREPAPESPLVDVIDPLYFWGGPMLSCATWDDQRGVDRPQDGNGRPETGGRTYGPYGPADVWCDIGAVEREAPPAPPTPVPVAPRFTG